MSDDVQKLYPNLGHERAETTRMHGGSGPTDLAPAEHQFDSR